MHLTGLCIFTFMAEKSLHASSIYADFSLGRLILREDKTKNGKSSYSMLQSHRTAGRAERKNNCQMSLKLPCPIFIIQSVIRILCYSNESFIKSWSINSQDNGFSFFFLFFFWLGLSSMVWLQAPQVGTGAVWDGLLDCVLVHIRSILGLYHRDTLEIYLGQKRGSVK